MPLAEPGAPTGAPHEDPLLERDDVLDAWRALLDVAGSGGGSLYLEGAPGIGKTRLADELACRATDAGFRVLCATGGELEQHFAFGIVHQLFDRLAATCPELLFAAHAAPARALLAPTGAEENAEEAALTHALFWLLANLAEQGPVALVIDDLHWSDAPSLAWLAYLERRLGDLPVAMLLTARPGADGVLERLRSSNRVLRPGELSLASVATLVGGGSPDACEPDDPFVEACHRATGGNPFLVPWRKHLIPTYPNGYPRASSKTLGSPRCPRARRLLQPLLPGWPCRRPEAVCAAWGCFSSRPDSAHEIGRTPRPHGCIRELAEGRPSTIGSHTAIPKIVLAAWAGYGLRRGNWLAQSQGPASLVAGPSKVAAVSQSGSHFLARSGEPTSTTLRSPSGRSSSMSVV